MLKNSTTPAYITPTQAAGKTSSPYMFNVNITQKLCHETCADNVPIFDPKFTFAGITPVGTGMYMVSIHVEGVIHYVPCNAGNCCTKALPVSQDFNIPLYSTAEPTGITLTTGTVVNGLARIGCKSCSRTFVSDSILSITVVTA